MQNKSISLCSRRAVPEYQCMYIYMYLFLGKRLCHD